MPGKSPYDAFKAFADPLANALACIAAAKLEVSPNGKNEVGKQHALYLTGNKVNDGYVVLKGDPRMEFRARMFYQIIEDDREGFGPYRVSTRSYDYSLRTTDHRGVIDYHWHPSGLSHELQPHIHIGTAQLADDAVLAHKQHLLTGRITLESVIRNAINLGAKPLIVKWDDRLVESEGPHKLFRSWA